ncbi:MAG: alpha/beta hydrolase [Brachybacterium sp.]|nr:alpha/beta hydrolase [Brachybacterium sp.]
MNGAHGHASPIVLIHGSRTSSSQWDLQVPLLEAAGHPCRVPDLPGHGTRQDEPFTTAEALATVRRTVRAHAAEHDGPVHLVGSSLGGMLAIAAAEDLHPLASLVLCGSSVQPRALTARAYGRGMRVLDALPGGDVSTRAVLARLLGAEGVEAYLRGGRAGVAVIAPSMAAVAGVDLRGTLTRITVPVTVLNGRYDQLRLHERSFARAAPRGRLQVLPSGTHLVNLTHPERFTAELLTAVAAAEARRDGEGVP